MAKLSTEKRKQYSEALLDAFSSHGELGDLYRSVFGAELTQTLSPGAPLAEVVDKILTICASRDNFADLFKKATQINPTNEALQKLLAETITKPQKPAEQVPAEETLPDPIIGFVNRKKELEAIFLNPGQISRYWVIDAPAGYGKSQLLAEAEKRYKKNNWQTVRVAFPRSVAGSESSQASSSILDLVAVPVLAQLRGPEAAEIDRSQLPEELGMDIATAILQTVKKTENNPLQGFAILVDNLENCPDEEVSNFLQLISGIFTGLSNNNAFFKSKRLRVFISGRYARNKIKNVRDQIMLADIPLTPFTFEVIVDTIQEFAISKGIPGGLQRIDDIAAQLTYITCGHPGYAAEILNLLAQDQFTRGVLPLIKNSHDYQDKFTKKFYQQLVQESPKFNEYHLIDILVNLSPFRKYERWVFLKELRERGYLPKELDEETLEKALLSTYLVDRKGGFLHDGMYRRLLETWLRLNNPALYAELCELGIEIYKKRLKSGENIRRFEKWAIEFIYLSLAQNYFVQKIAGKKLEQQTQENMAWVIAELARVKTNFSQEDFESVREDFFTDLNEDAELRFLYNFCVAEDNHFKIRAFDNLLSFANQEFSTIS